LGWRQRRAGFSAPAQFGLGFLHSDGDGVPRDDGEAARLWRLAAAQDEPFAQLGLGGLYVDGTGVARDYVEAARLLWMAAKQEITSRHAADLLKNLSSEREYVSACCMGCGATRKLKNCIKCKVARFCGAECQKRAWTEHKPHCRRWEAEAAEKPA
jgi:TPR repeat protein